MGKKITIKLSNSGIDKAIKELVQYLAWLDSKTNLLRERLAQELAADAQMAYASTKILTWQSVKGQPTVVDERVPDIAVSYSTSGDITVVTAYGEEAVWVEFGTGVFNNGPVGTAVNEWAANNGFRIGTYGKRNGAKKVWGYYDGGDSVTLTSGIPASQALYGATRYVADRFAAIAKEVFT